MTLMRRDLMASLAVATAAAAPASKPVSRVSVARRRQQLYSLLGDLPPRHRPVTATRRSLEDRGAYSIETLVLDLNGIEAAPAYFVKPKGATGRLRGVRLSEVQGGSDRRRCCSDGQRAHRRPGAQSHRGTGQDDRRRARREGASRELTTIGCRRAPPVESG